MKIISLGGSGASRSIFKIIEKIDKFELKGFLDNRIPNENFVDGFRCLGKFYDAKFFKEKGYKFVTGIGSEKTFRNKSTKIYSYQLDENDFVKLISSNSIIETKSEYLKSGCVIFDDVFIGYQASIGSLTIINSKAYIGHETEVGDYSFIGPNSTISGNTKISSSVYIGAGATIKDHVQICSNVLIGCGAVVTKNIDSPGIYVGVPAKLLKNF